MEREPANRKVMRQVLAAPVLLGTMLLVSGTVSVLHRNPDSKLLLHGIPLLTCGFLFIGATWYAIHRLFREMILSKDHLSSIVRSLADPLFAVDSTGRIRTVNRAAMEQLEHNALELTGKNLGTFLATDSSPTIPAEDFKKLTHQAVRDFECLLVSKSGRKVPVLLSTSPIQESTGRLSGVVCLAKDISERKKAESEARQMQQQLAHASKLASLGTIGSGVAHELNNPLTIVKASAELIAEAKVSGDVRREAKEIIRCAGRMKKITDHLRLFARENKKEDWAQLDVNTPIKHSLMLLNQKIKSNDIKLKLNYGANLPRIWGDASQLESVFQNLLSNSRDSFEDVKEDRPKIITITTKVNETGGITVEYEDTAAGIPPEIIDRIFDPFFTTKEAGKGTGLGMSIIHGIIESHRGKIKVESRVGRGTCFTITLPQDRRETSRAKAAPKPPKVKSVARTKKGPLPTMLIVDDEPGIAQLLKLILKGHFEANIITDSRKACDEIAAKKYDMVVTDLQMPYVSGLGILQKVKECQGETPLVLMSGHGDSDPKVKKVLETGAAGVLDKPFSSPSVVRAFLLKCLEECKGDGAKRRAA